MMTSTSSWRRRRQRPAAHGRRTATAAIAVALTVWWSATASAQLDPLLFLKRVPPTVIILVDTGMRMLEDGNGNYYDPNTYLVANDVPAATAFGVAGANSYRRVIKTLQYENVQDAATKFEATDIVALPDSSPAYASFFYNTRLEVAKRGIDTAVSENAGLRWGLLKLRQSTPAWRAANDCDKPVRVTNNPVLALANDTSPCNAGAAGKYGLYVPKVSAPNYSNETAFGGGAQVVAPASANASTNIITLVRRPIGDANGLIPAGQGARAYGDRPLTHLLEDAKQAAINAMHADAASMRTCRNTVVILITAGKDDGDNAYQAGHDAAAVATSFLKVTSDNVERRVPIHVLAIKPAADHEASLRTIATNSGGVYRNVSTSDEVSAAILHAVQAGFARAADFDKSVPSEFLPVSPIVGTVNLKGAADIGGNALPDTDIVANPGGQHLPQRSNLILTSGFRLPGFEGVLRAFRAYKPVVDATKPIGWKFVSDGTRLWPDLDGRSSLAGMARVPADPTNRNIYTYVPDGAGGGNVVAFTAANEAQLRTALGTPDAATTTALISMVRAQPLGAVIGSTPAIMDPPSLDPPPDDDYGRADAADSFAGRHKNRRAIIFFGANDGMIHAVDARTGYEVWAFIPYNLLPKLRTIRDGQAVEQFDYFVDSSPKVAEVKIHGAWKSVLIIGEGPGGTFYQAFDVSEAGMGVSPDAGDLAAVNSLLAQFDTPNESIQFKWAFPNYSSFDPTYAAILPVTDATPGGKMRVFGDVKATASFAEKTVGYTWSDPAVGTLTADRSVTAVIVGSGYFPDKETVLPGRGAGAPKAGNALYLLDVDTGLPIGNAAGDSCPTISSGNGSGSGCVSIGDTNGDQRKNALQADPTAAGDNGSIIVNKAYLGDVDGKYWRFGFTSAGVITARQMIDTSQPIYASSALLFIGSTDVYMFFATGSDLLPTVSPAGTGTFKLYGLKDNYPANGATVKFSRNLSAVTDVNGVVSGERPSTSPSVAGDIVFYSTTVEAANAPCADYNARLYGLTYAGGAAYDANNNGRIDANESPVVATMSGRATAPFIVDQHLYVGTPGAGGASLQMFGDPDDFNNGIGQVGVRILSWREIR